MTTAIEPCRAGFDGCDAMRAEDVRKHPRTPRLAECRHYPIPPEDPSRLRGPEVGATVLYKGERWTVIERSYVWAPGERSGSRRYDLKVIAYEARPSRHLLVDDKDLEVIA